MLWIPRHQISNAPSAVCRNRGFAWKPLWPLHFWMDGFPVSEGHTLVIPKPHVESLFDLLDRELVEVRVLAAEARSLLQEKHKPDGFNIGLNDGQAAGQTISHAHIHVIPRFKGDVPHP
jgi:diadenosine tetraphosphate (Ap4A) HIT family hydrolase